MLARLHSGSVITMLRAYLWSFGLLLAGPTLFASTAAAEILPLRWQVFAIRSGYGGDGLYWGVAVHARYMPATNLANGDYNAIPVGVGNMFSSNPYPYIESGGRILPCASSPCDGTVYPYYTWAESDMAIAGFTDTSTPFDPALFYQYSSYYIGSNSWRAQYCGEATCVLLVDHAFATDTSPGFPFVAAGGEGAYDLNPVPIGDGTDRNALFLPLASGTWQFWDTPDDGCYNSNHISAPAPAYLTDCDKTDYSWRFGYAP